MKLGAAVLVKGWGTKMSLSRDGVTLATFKGRAVYNDTESQALDALDGSVSQYNIMIIACVEDFRGVVPRKFDNITIGADLYTVQRSRAVGADEPELFRIHVRGGQP